MRALEIVLADSGTAERGALARALTDLGHRLIEVADQAGLEEALRAAPSDLVLVDASLPPAGGIAAVQAVKRAHPSCPVALGIRAPDVATVLDAFHAGAYDVLLQDGGTGVVYVPVMNYVEGDMAAVREMLVHPRSVPGLGDAGAHCTMICDASFCTYLLQYWTREAPEGQRLTPEWVVQPQVGQWWVSRVRSPCT